MIVLPSRGRTAALNRFHAMMNLRLSETNGRHVARGAGRVWGVIDVLFLLTRVLRGFLGWCIVTPRGEGVLTKDTRRL